MKTFTYFSYKGGTDRSRLLADTARYLALLGHRVIAVDFAFEASDPHRRLNVGLPG
ncbi:MAG: hypothetical protein HC897_19645 [Thermoanaerobaculia bacterium]|nr:hypothetical protein [Thermoanaerobaculia bacterium]